MNMQNACATLFKIKIGFRFQIWLWMRSSFISSKLQLWVKVKGSVAIRKKRIWLLQQTTKMKGCTIFKIHFNISDPTPRPILNVHSTQMPPNIADKLWKLLETLPTSLGGWESFGTDLQLVVHNLPDFSSRNAKLQHPENLQLLQIWAKCQSFNVAWPI